MEIPQTHYARSGDVSIAWQKFGSGARRIIFAPGFISHAELIWEQPRAAYFLQRLGRMGQVVLFDKRGTGMSDRVADMPTLDQRMDDIAAVMDAAGFVSADLMGFSEGGAMCQLFAATYPQRVDSLVLQGSYGSFRHWVQSGGDFEAFLSRLEANWGYGRSVANFAPSLKDDVAFVAWWARYERSSASPGAVKSLMRMNNEIDIRAVLSTIKVPTLILHRTNDVRVSVEASRYAASVIPNARFIEYPGFDHLAYVGDNVDVQLDDIEEFLTGERPKVEIERVLATVMFTDIVDSTRQAGAIGDRQWTAKRQSHDLVVRDAIERHRGRVVKAMGDGFLAVFDGPARAVRAGQMAALNARQLGLPIRVGLHTGEIALESEDVAGIAVAIAARVAALAGANEVFVSSTVRDLVAGSGLKFDERGLQTLKGIDEPMRIFAAGSA